MILVRIRKYANLQNVQHIATSWKVASDKAMTDIIDEKPNSNMLELYYSNIEVPDGVTYYVQARRHFNQSNMDYDVEPIAVSNNDQAYNNMLFQEDSYIEEPYVVINRDELMNNDDATLTFKTSKFRSSYDKHKATHYIILDSNNEVIFTRMNETQHLTSLEIPNSWEYRNRNKVTFMAIHVGASGMESKVGKKVLFFNRDINWKFDKNIVSVEPNIDLTLTFIPLNDTPVDIRRVELITPTTGEIVLTFDQFPITEFTIPWNLLLEDISYDLKITYISNAQRITTTKRLTTANYNNLVIRDPEFTYKNTIITKSLDAFYIPNNLHVEMMYNGNLLIPKETKRLDIYRWDSVNKELIKTTKSADGIRLLSDNIKNTLVKPFTRGLILIDTLNDDLKPTFLLYRYNLKDNTFTLLSTVPRLDETESLGGTGSFVQTDFKTLYYLAVGTNKLRRYNIETKTIEDMLDIPLENMTKGILLRSRSGRLFICNSSKYEAVMYNIKSNKVTEGYQFGPESFINKTLKSVQLMNGSSLVFFSGDDANSTNGSFQYYNIEKGNFIATTQKFTDKHPPKTSLFMNTGEVVLLESYDFEDNQGRLSHKAEMYLYS